MLLTGGAGYIGSHTALALLEQGHDVAVIDDLSNSKVESLRRVEELTGGSIRFFEHNLANSKLTDSAFSAFAPEAVIHFAGLKAVGESVEQPLRYYRTNIGSTLALLEVMHKHDVKRLVFSSSATVYGVPQTDLIAESHPTGVTVSNPYGWTKAMNEQIIRDFAATWPELGAVILRYFNPIGAHPSGRIGEDPNGIPNNLMPFISQVAVGRRASLAVFGDDYPTADGTGVRDYIHVMDLAEGHIAALLHAEPGWKPYNLGTGEGRSVLDAVRAFEAASGRSVPYQVHPRRDGDLATVIADPSLAQDELGWRASRTFEDACRDTWSWQSANPMGYSA